MDTAQILKKLKDQAKQNAMKRIQNQFNTPDQLEFIEQHISKHEKETVHLF